MVFHNVLCDRNGQQIKIEISARQIDNCNSLYQF